MWDIITHTIVISERIFSMNTPHNILASRYASKEMAALWMPEAKVLLERKLWLSVLKNQRSLGIDIPAESIEAYSNVLETVDMASISARERITRHDVKARIEEYCALAGEEDIHRGLTSRDVTDNADQVIVMDAFLLVISKARTSLAMLRDMAEKFATLPIAARTHNVPAQLTTLGKRFSIAGEELMESLKAADSLLKRQKMRGFKGAVGTQQDLLDMFDGDQRKVDKLESKVAQEFGFSECMNSVGQIYPRSLDAEIIACLLRLASAPSSLSITLRLMAGDGHVSEDFSEGQVGSSAMPHKMNARLCERINGLKIVLGGYMSMAAELSGSQWNEGDISCSVVRRVMLPDAFFACDGIFESFISVLNSLQIVEASLRSEINSNLPYLLSSRLLTFAVENGMGREATHKILRKHLSDRENITVDVLAARLGKDTHFAMTEKEVAALLNYTDLNVGSSLKQIETFLSDSQKYLGNFPDVSGYKPVDVI